MTGRHLVRALAVATTCCAMSASGVAAKGRAHRQALAIPAGVPKTLVIQKIHVRAPVESLDFTKPREKDAPHRWGDVAWYNRGPRPGERGRAAFFGHLDSYCCPAVFYHLKDLRPGDTFQVYYRSGKPLTFKVQWGNSFWNNKLPLQFMFGRSSERGVVLMTCTGVFHRGAGYDRKWILYGRVVMPNGQVG